jgi:predicted alpha/beta hydrolase family esterase
VPRAGLRSRSLVAPSPHDPLAGYDRIVDLAAAWGSELVDLGEVGHLNPASGYGEWPRADEFIDELSTVTEDAV